MLPIMVACGAYVLDNLENVSGKANCFNMQEEEEDSEEEVDDLEESKKLIVSSLESSAKFSSSAKRFYAKIILRNTVYLPGVPSPPPELS